LYEYEKEDNMENIKNKIFYTKGKKMHTKASEEYVEVELFYADDVWKGWIPIEYRRTGTSIKNEKELEEYLIQVYDFLKPDKFEKWLNEQNRFWKEEKKGATTTKTFYDGLIDGGWKSGWKCTKCQLPRNNNFARRIQDLKEYGYTIATDIKRYCSTCKKNVSHLMLIPLPRNGISGNGYEIWSPKLRKKIIKTLKSIDVYENSYRTHVLPDHKFPEIRWGEDTKTINEDNMTEKEIKDKFQLISNRRNQQKREVCRKCKQENKRGYPFGIKYYYKGEEYWDNKIPKEGKEAEKGCVGCGWYDLEKWRKELNKTILKLQ